MNERLKELLEQASEVHDYWYRGDSQRLVDHKMFAELIIQECISTIENAENGYQDYRNQIENGMRKHCIWLIKDKFGVE
jgi:hypothetical protein